MTRFDDSTRRRLATGWDPRVSTLRDYARQHSVSERALRNWRTKYPVTKDSPVPARHLDVPAGAAADALLARLAALDQALDAARAALGAARAALDDAGPAAERTNMTAPAVVAGDHHAKATEGAALAQEQPPASEAPATPIPKPFPMRRSYFQDFQ